MVTSVMNFNVADYGHWRPFFESLEGLRQSHGQIGHRVLQSMENPNELIILIDWEDGERASAYFASPDLQAAMKDSGMQGPPTRWVTQDVT